MVTMSDDQAAKVTSTSTEELEAAVDDHFMNEEVSEAVGHDSVASRRQQRLVDKPAEENHQKAGDCEDEGKGVVSFHSLRVRFMMITMNFPQKAVHDVLVQRPSNEFHSDETGEEDQKKHASEISRTPKCSANWLADFLLTNTES